MKTQVPSQSSALLGVAYAIGAATVFSTAGVIVRRIDLPLRDILDEADVSTRFFYRHFGSKESFLLVLLQDLFDQLADHVAQSVGAATDPHCGIIAWVNGVLDHAEPETASLGRPLLVHGARLAGQDADAGLADPLDDGSQARG